MVFPEYQRHQSLVRVERKPVKPTVLRPSCMGLQRKKLHSFLSGSSMRLRSLLSSLVMAMLAAYRMSALGALVVLVAGAHRLTSQTIPTSPALQLRVEAPATVPSTAQIVRLQLTLTNTSQKPIWIWDTNILHDFTIALLAANGTAVPMTSRGEQLRQGDNEFFTHVVKRKIDPKASLATQLDLREYYDLSPGSYTIRATLRRPPEGSVAPETESPTKDNKNRKQVSASASMTVTP